MTNCHHFYRAVTRLHAKMPIELPILLAIAYSKNWESYARLNYISVIILLLAASNFKSIEPIELILGTCSES